jgi:hypothetical protein
MSKKIFSFQHFKQKTSRNYEVSLIYIEKIKNCEKIPRYNYSKQTAKNIGQIVIKRVQYMD